MRTRPIAVPLLRVELMALRKPAGKDQCGDQRAGDPITAMPTPLGYKTDQGPGRRQTGLAGMACNAAHHRHADRSGSGGRHGRQAPKVPKRAGARSADEDHPGADPPRQGERRPAGLPAPTCGQRTPRFRADVAPNSTTTNALIPPMRPQIAGSAERVTGGIERLPQGRRFPPR